MSMRDTDSGKHDSNLVYLQALIWCDSMNMGVGDSQYVNATRTANAPFKG